MLRWLLIGPFVLVIVLFALSNSAPVALRLWPFDLAWQVPLSLAVLIIAGVFFLLGAIIAWLASLPARGRARDLRGQVQTLEMELARYRAEAETERQRDVNGASRALRPVA
ncbi:LapA family protein [Plastoroseomonas arctica]|uniref:LapA family protein n=1 Tax=Plastoroseomonas arctica TaxID=1509237 RepID=A0AAF1JYJ0_9PROT|nr:LapA family protein [Plastoroseomonas arctica]MBR0654099.1 LapA family protein [Plastoroseomonas arctica]